MASGGPPCFHCGSSAWAYDWVEATSRYFLPRPLSRTLVLYTSKPKGLAPDLLFGLGLGCGFAATYAHWVWHLYTHYGSPTFPVFNRIFASPYVPSINTWHYDRLHGPGVFLLLPFLFALDSSYVSEILGWHDWRCAIVYVLVIAVGALLLYRPRMLAWDKGTRKEQGVFVLCMTAVAYMAWLMTEPAYRFLLPIGLLAPLIIVVCVDLLPFKPETRGTAFIAIALVLAITARPCDWVRRHEWSQRIVEIERPSLPDTSETMILMSGILPYAYLLSDFPPHIPILRIDSNSIKFNSGWGIVDLIRQRIAEHNGRFMIFAPSADMSEAEPPLRLFGLRQLPETCQDVVDRIPEQLPDGDAVNGLHRKYKLCEVVRSEG